MAGRGQRPLGQGGVEVAERLLGVDVVTLGQASHKVLARRLQSNAVTVRLVAQRARRPAGTRAPKRHRGGILDQQLPARLTTGHVIAIAVSAQCVTAASRIPHR